jgi:hypothetical protein
VEAGDLNGDVINLDGFRLKTRPDPVSNPADQPCESFRIPLEDSASFKDAYINKYKQTQRNSYYLNQDPSFEIKF